MFKSLRTLVLKSGFMLLVATPMFAYSSVSLAQTVSEIRAMEAQSAAEELFKSMNYEAQFKKTLDKLIDAQIVQNPSLKPYKYVMVSFFNKYMSWESLKGDIIALYSETFTAGELEELTAFYQTPLGQKALKHMPTLTAKGAAIGQQRVKAHEKEFFNMMREARKKHEAEQ